MSNETCIADNPCWGGPDPSDHNLDHLIQVLGRPDKISENGTDQRGPESIRLSGSNYDQFLQRIHSRLILYNDENYLAIHKPADLRMDGPHLATVHKLLLYLFPPPSLCDIVMKENAAKSLGESNIYENDETNTISAETIIDKTNEEILPSYKAHRQLVENIYKLPNHASLPDDPFRTVHQLDYATSGVLLLAKNKRAAGIACTSFMNRKTCKQYLAVVTNSHWDGENENTIAADAASGNDSKYTLVPPMGKEFMEKLPILPSSALAQWENGALERTYRKKRRRETETRDTKKGTFNGYIPVHAVFAKWRGLLLKKQKAMQYESCNTVGPEPRGDGNLSTEKRGSDRQREQQVEKKKWKKNSDRVTKDPLPPLPEPKQSISTNEIDELLSLGPSWKSVKNSKRADMWVPIMEAMAKEYNELLQKFYTAKHGKEDEVESTEVESKRISSLPPLFRIDGDDCSESSCNNNNKGNNLGIFYICASIGEPDDGSFCVVVDPAAKKPSSITSDDKTPSTLAASLDLKPSLTKCTVLWRGYSNLKNGKQVPVAKVMLHPRTGRRHQLRIHLSEVCGFPILGDVAYGGDITEWKSSDGNDCSNGTTADEKGKSCDRMCLHARQLSIPLMNDTVKTFIAPDPFLIQQIGDVDESLLIL
ncbi:hypothetical protein ACHAXS_012869 [Conticribra weissflogii]